MPRILGVDIPKNKKIKISLRFLFGVGPVNALDILSQTNIDPEKKAGELNEEEISRIVSYLQSHIKVEGELRRAQTQN
ncbi:MAG: 30S ribosomal protein S13, partial [Candidatus Omnitrophota bacterium]